MAFSRLAARRLPSARRALSSGAKPSDAGWRTPAERGAQLGTPPAAAAVRDAPQASGSYPTPTKAAWEAPLKPSEWRVSHQTAFLATTVSAALYAGYRAITADVELESPPDLLGSP